MNRVDFQLGLKEVVTNGLKRIKSVGDSVFSGLTASATKMGTSFSTAGAAAGNALGAMEYKLRSVKSAADDAGRSVNNLNNHISKGGGEGFSFRRMAASTLVGGMALSGLQMAGREAVGLGRSALEMGMQTERQIVGLSTFVGDKKAAGIYAGLQEQAVKTPFTTSQLMPIEFGLIATGRTPERANRDMMGLANAVASTGGTDFMLELMGSHLAQASSADKIDGMIRREFQRTAHIPINALLAKDMYANLPLKQGLKKVDAMESISYEQFTHALNRASEAGGMFAGGMEKLSQTMYGKATTLKDWWGIGLSKLTMSQRGNIVGLEDRMIGALQGFPEVIAKITPVVGLLFDRFNELVPGLRDFGGSLMGLLRPVGGMLMSEGMLGLGKGVIGLASEVMTELTPAVKLAAQGLTGLTSVINPLINSITNWRQNMLTSVVEGVNKVLDQLHPERKGIAAQSKNVEDLGLKGNVIRLAPGQTLTDYYKANPGVMPQPILGTINMPGVKASAVKSAGSASDADSTDAIVGGGRKVVNIRLDSLIKHLEIHAGSVKEGVQEMKMDVTEALLRVLRSVPG